MTSRLLFCLLFAFALPAAAQSPLPEVAVKRVDVEGEQVFEVRASGVVKAPPAVVWQILTDYERMPEFVPDLKTARILSRTGNRAILEQSGVARFLFLRRPIHLVVQTHEEPMSAIDISLVAGDMKVYVCRWEISQLPDGGTAVAYSGKMVPKFYVPGMLGANIIRRDVERMMGAVLQRLDRP